MENIKINNRQGVLKIRLNNLNDEPILNSKGEEVFWEFDIQDIELVETWTDIVEQHSKNEIWHRNQLVIIKKRKDVKGKYSDSKNTEDILEAYKEFSRKEIANLNRFLGENGVEKFLNGRKPYYEMFNDISNAIEQVLPYFEKAIEEFKKDIKEKYKTKEEDILE